MYVNLAKFLLEKINFISMINSAFFKTPFYSDTYLSNAFWMYGAFFMGSIYIYLICIALKKYDEAWNDGLKEENEYAIGDRKSMESGAGEYLCFIMAVLEKK